MSSYAEVMARVWNGRRLFSVLLELTYRCNLDCFFCYNDLGLRGRMMRLPRYRQLLSELRDLGAMNLSLSGGEPLAHPDFFAIGADARQRGFVVRIKTNGHALGRSLADRIQGEIDPFLLEVSLHGASAPVHDRQTRVTGSFDRLLHNLDAIRAAGLRVQLNGVLTAWNQDEIEQMFLLADGLGLPLQLDSRVTPRDDGDTAPLSIAPAPEAMHRLLRLQRQRLAPHHPQAPGGRKASATTATRNHCGAGTSTLTIDPFGNVYPCVQWRRSAGNLHQQRLTEIWGDSPVLREVRGITEGVAVRIRELGPRARLAGFCPGFAEQTLGSPASLDPVTLQRLRMHESLAGVERGPRDDAGPDDPRPDADLSSSPTPTTRPA